MALASPAPARRWREPQASHADADGAPLSSSSRANIVETLVQEVSRVRAELEQEAERADMLQRMLGSDKALAALARALAASVLSALWRWRQFAAADGRLTPEAATMLAMRKAAAEALAAEAAAQLEAEETRRAEAEKLAFEEGRRRRRAEAELVERTARLDAEAHTTASACDERLAECVAARRTDASLARAFGALRAGGLQAALRTARTEAVELASLVREREADAAASEGQASRAAEQLRSQLRTAQREASEANLASLSARQQRAEALAKAAAHDHERLDALARAGSLEGQHGAVCDRLGEAVHAARACGPALRRWSQRVAARRVQAAGLAGEAESHAARAALERHVAELHERAEAAARDAGSHAAAAAAARSDSDRAVAHVEMRLRKSELGRAADAERARVEAGTLLGAELRSLELQSGGAARQEERLGRALCERVAAARRQHSTGAALTRWGLWASRRRDGALQSRLMAAEAAAREQSRQCDAMAAVADSRAFRGAEARAWAVGRIASQVDRWWAGAVLRAWHLAVGREARRAGQAALRAEVAARHTEAAAAATAQEAVEAAAEAAVAEAAAVATGAAEAAAEAQRESQSRIERLQAEIAAAARELGDLRLRVHEQQQAAEAAARERARERSDAAAALAAVRERLEESERACQAERARAARCEDDCRRLEEELQASELRTLWQGEQAAQQAAQQASAIHEQLHASVLPSPMRTSRMSARAFDEAGAGSSRFAVDE